MQHSTAAHQRSTARSSAAGVHAPQQAERQQRRPDGEQRHQPPAPGSVAEAEAECEE